MSHIRSSISIELTMRIWSSAPNTLKCVYITLHFLHQLRQGRSTPSLRYSRVHMRSQPAISQYWFDSTHCGLAPPQGDKGLSQHWLSWWLGACRHQAITWTNVDLSSVMSCGIHQRTLSWGDLEIPISKSRLKIPLFESHSDLPGANELTVTLLHPNILPFSVFSVRYPWQCCLVPW